MSESLKQELDTAPRRESNLRFIFRALKYPNYRLFFVGQIVSLCGTWLTLVATTWLVYRLAAQRDPTTAPQTMGLVAFIGQLPMFLLAPFGGVLADRFNQHRVLVITQTLAMLQSFVLAYLALSHQITIAHILVLNLLQGLINAIDIPSRQAFVVSMVENRDDLSNAIALNSSMVHGARLIGPAIAGILIFWFQEGVCFLIDGISYIAVIAALLAMRITPVVRTLRPEHPLRAFKEGLKYAFGFKPTRILLLLSAITSLMLASQSVALPIFADQVLGARQHAIATEPVAGDHAVALQPPGNKSGNARVYGLLLGCSGAGAFLGSLYLARRRTVLGLGRVIVWANLAMGVGLIVFSFSRLLPLSLFLLLFVGGGMVVQIAASNTILQTLSDDDKRGRLMSLFAMAFMGMSPFGSVLGGEAIHFMGAPRTLLCAGIVCLIAGSAFALKLPGIRPLIRPVYVQRGIILEVATGIETTSAAVEANQD